MPISRRRARQRASIMFETLAQAISRISPKAANAGRKPVMVARVSVTTVARCSMETRSGVRPPGQAPLTWRPYVSNAAWAPSTMTPGFRRPTGVSLAGCSGPNRSGPPAVVPEAASETHAEMGVSLRPLNSGQATPTISTGRLAR